MLKNTILRTAVHKSEFQLIKDTRYLAIMDELWGIYCEDLGETSPCYDGTTLYIASHLIGNQGTIMHNVNICP